MQDKRSAKWGALSIFVSGAVVVEQFLVCNPDFIRPVAGLAQLERNFLVTYIHRRSHVVRRPAPQSGINFMVFVSTVMTDVGGSDRVEPFPKSVR